MQPDTLRVILALQACSIVCENTRETWCTWENAWAQRLAGECSRQPRKHRRSKAFSVRQSMPCKKGSTQRCILGESVL